MSLNIPRRTYADLYGPTTGDRVRLALCWHIKLFAV